MTPLPNFWDLWDLSHSPFVWPTSAFPFPTLTGHFRLYELCWCPEYVQHLSSWFLSSRPSFLFQVSVSRSCLPFSKFWTGPFFFSDIKTKTGFPAKTRRWPNKFTCTLKINSKTLVHFLEEKVLNADSNLMVKQLLDPRWPTKKISLYWATRLEQVLLSETSLIKGKPQA